MEPAGHFGQGKFSQMKRNMFFARIEDIGISSQVLQKAVQEVLGKPVLVTAIESRSVDLDQHVCIAVFRGACFEDFSKQDRAYLLLSCQMEIVSCEKLRMLLPSGNESIERYEEQYDSFGGQCDKGPLYVYDLPRK